MRSFVVLLFVCVKYCNYTIYCGYYTDKSNNSISTESNNNILEDDNSQKVSTNILTEENNNGQTVNTGTFKENNNSQNVTTNISKEENSGSEKGNEYKGDHINNLKHSNNNENENQQNEIEQNNIFYPENYIFSKKGLKNIGSTCYMNATLQCLLHVNELTNYFKYEYPNDKQTLSERNESAVSKGNISKAFYDVLCGVTNTNDTNNSFSPDEFKKCLGTYNTQFNKFEANDSKDLILYLFQTIHAELNYLGNINKRLTYMPNQYNIYDTYQHFITNYNANDFSIISKWFYGTYKNATTCSVCKNTLYNFQKFEFISFAMYAYNKKKFNLFDGFRDNASPTILKGDNKYLCTYCRQVQDAETECKIYEPPLKLLINLDYGKNKKYQPSSIEFDEEIDITKFVDFDYGQKIRYRLIGVCTHLGNSGATGHYIAFCKNTAENVWYKFNDAYVSKCENKDIHGGTPYLLLYERVFS